MHKLRRTRKVPDMLHSMAVTRQHDRNFILHTILQDLPVVCSCITTISIWRKRSLIDLEDNPILFGTDSQSLIIYRKSWIITVSQDFDTWTVRRSKERKMRSGSEQGLCMGKNLSETGKTGTAGRISQSAGTGS